ncbi:hypothetical protein C2G38_2033850 [Gigaspora rosea]|uniref:Autophagy-related protein 16 domain-containing protein n=1 Tax=Gigaspora rosea TaxID=44941 RepID=A0A397VI00_9GLOM|nr:hypothetical protein C2G38_2033850 [Gigaspora rosea]
MPELANRHSSLATYIICQRHYNQIVANDYYNLASLDQEGALPDTDQDNLAMNYTDHNVAMSYTNLTVELDRTRGLLEVAQIENQQKSQFLEDQRNEIVELRNQLQKAYEDMIMTRNFLEHQRNEIVELKNQVQKVYDDVITARNLYEEQLRISDTLAAQWNSRFDNQQKRIDAIVEIAKAERVSLFEDLEQLIRDSDRFSLENLMVYSPREWLNKCNQVSIEFVLF